MNEVRPAMPREIFFGTNDDVNKSCKNYRKRNYPQKQFESVVFGEPYSWTFENSVNKTRKHRARQNNAVPFDAQIPYSERFRRRQRKSQIHNCTSATFTAPSFLTVNLKTQSVPKLFDIISSNLSEFSFLTKASIVPAKPPP